MGAHQLRFTSPNRSFEGNGTSPNPGLLRWDVKTIEVASPNVGDISTAQQTRSHKKKAIVALMTHILDTCNIESYVDA